MNPTTTPLRHTVPLSLGEQLVVSGGARWVTLRVQRVGGDFAPLADGLMIDVAKLPELRQALETLERALSPVGA